MEDRRDKKKAGKPWEREAELAQIEVDLLKVRETPMILSYNVRVHRCFPLPFLSLLLVLTSLGEWLSRHENELWRAV